MFWVTATCSEINVKHSYGLEGKHDCSWLCLAVLG